MLRSTASVVVALLAIGIVTSMATAEPSGIDAAALRQRGDVSYDRVPRKVLAFYYPWYGTPGGAGPATGYRHWGDADRSARTVERSTHYPTLGRYDSFEPKVLTKHTKWAADAGVDGFVVSWWGHGDYSDRALGPILDACEARGLDATVYYERVPDPKTAASAATDILKLLRAHADHPAWLTVDGKPVIFVYGRAVGQLGLDGWLRAIDRVNEKLSRDVAFIGDRLSRPAARIFDGIHTYNPASTIASADDVGRWAGRTYPEWVGMAERTDRISTVTVVPGYDDTKIRTPGLAVGRRDGALYAEQWKQVLTADPDWVLVTSFNEWHEGSEIEPSAEHGEKYLKATAKWAGRFKAQPRTTVDRPGPAVDAEKLARLRKTLRDRVAILPNASSTALWWLVADVGLEPAQPSWEEVADGITPRQRPIVVYAGGEDYRRTVSTEGDVDAAIKEYLRGGGLLMALPAGPMPFHYDEEGTAVGNARALGLPLRVGDGDGVGGWEEPPAVDLRFEKRSDALAHLPKSWPYPRNTHPRWRPFAAKAIASQADVTRLIDLTDGKGRHYGAAAAYAAYQSGPLADGRVLYAWFGLLDGQRAAPLLYDLFRFAAEKRE